MADTSEYSDDAIDEKYKAQVHTNKRNYVFLPNYIKMMVMINSLYASRWLMVVPQLLVTGPSLDG